MLQRNLIYTGITRAKKVCELIGQTKVLSYAIRNLTVSKRNTKLKERLRAETLKKCFVLLFICNFYLLLSAKTSSLAYAYMHGHVSFEK